jgi:hypothetical protein
VDHSGIRACSEHHAIWCADETFREDYFPRPGLQEDNAEHLLGPGIIDTLLGRRDLQWYDAVGFEQLLSDFGRKKECIDARDGVYGMLSITTPED